LKDKEGNTNISAMRDTLSAPLYASASRGQPPRPETAASGSEPPLDAIVASFQAGGYASEGERLLVQPNKMETLKMLPDERIRSQLDPTYWRDFGHRVCHVTANVFVKYAVERLTAGGWSMKYVTPQSGTGLQSIADVIRGPSDGIYRFLVKSQGEYSEYHDFVIVVSEGRWSIVENNIYGGVFHEEPHVDVFPIPNPGQFLNGVLPKGFKPPKGIYGDELREHVHIEGRGFTVFREDDD
jgi:hypothetical protein